VGVSDTCQVGIVVTL